MKTNDGADVAIKPPILFLAALGLGYVLSLYLPLGPGLSSANGLAVFVGLLFVVLGLLLTFFPARRFRRAGTSVVPGQPSTVLVTEGAYKVTRNPMYVGMALAYFGLTILLTSVWMLLLFAPVLLILHRCVVLREEDYLQRKFGDAYRAYTARVPRWL